MNAQVYELLLAAGLLLFLVGLSHRISVISQWDAALFRQLNTPLQGRLPIGLFRLIWPIGTTAFTVLALLALIMIEPKMGLLASISLFCAAVIERIVKLKVQRIRPFAQLPGVSMHQPSRPKDPSFPSGDSLRVWFLVSLVLCLYPLPWFLILGILLLACLVTSGRIAMGVHYPGDVLGGAGLGILAAGACLLVSNFMPL